MFLAQQTLGGGDAATSLHYAGAGAGPLLGFALLAGLGLRCGQVAVMLAVASAGNLVTGLAWSIPTAFAFQAIRGPGISLIDVSVNMLVQRSVPISLQGEHSPIWTDSLVSPQERRIAWAVPCPMLPIRGSR